MHKLLPAAFFTILLTLFLLNGALAAGRKVPAKIRIDSSKIEVKKFDANALKTFRADKDFNYDGTAPGGWSWWAAFWHWVWGGVRWLLRNSKGGGFILTIIGYLLLAGLVALVIYVIFKAIGIDVLMLWKRGPQKISVPYTEALENIHEINFDDEIEKAVAQHNYRLAVRLLYLKCLKQLNDSQLIQWQIDKTNSAYLYELVNPVQKETFGILTRQFEYIWYGNFAIDQQKFGSINLLFQNFKKQLP